MEERAEVLALRQENVALRDELARYKAPLRGLAAPAIAASLVESAGDES